MSHNQEKDSAEVFRYLILAAERQGGRMFKGSMKKIGVTGSQAEVLRVLYENEPLSLKELGKLLICESGSPSRLVNHLVVKGYVRRESNLEDSRYVLLTLTTKGKEKAEQVIEMEGKMYDELNRLIPEEWLEKLNFLLGNVLSSQPISETLRNRGFLDDIAQNDKRDDE